MAVRAAAGMQAPMCMRSLLAPSHPCGRVARSPMAAARGCAVRCAAAASVASASSKTADMEDVAATRLPPAQRTVRLGHLISESEVPAALSVRKPALLRNGSVEVGPVENQPGAVYSLCLALAALSAELAAEGNDKVLLVIPSAADEAAGPDGPLTLVLALADAEPMQVCMAGACRQAGTARCSRAVCTAWHHPLMVICAARLCGTQSQQPNYAPAPAHAAPTLPHTRTRTPY
jgi:hypothetical protein